MALPQQLERGGHELGGHAVGAGDADLVFDLLLQGRPLTLELRDAITARSGVRGRTMGIPRWVLKTAGLLVPLAREIEEMAYQWEVPYTVDCSVMEERYGLTPTPLAEIAAALVGSAGVLAA